MRREGKIKSFFHYLPVYGCWSTGIIYVAIILGIIGYFFLKAGVEESAKYVVNTDKAFDFIGDNVGHLYFVRWPLVQSVTEFSCLSMVWLMTPTRIEVVTSLR